MMAGFVETRPGNLEIQFGRGSRDFRILSPEKGGNTGTQYLIIGNEVFMKLEIRLNRLLRRQKPGPKRDN
jgi:hypothetical protein